MDLGVVAQPQLERVHAQRIGELVDRGFQREVALRVAPAPRIEPGAGCSARPCRSLVCTLGQAYARAEPAAERLVVVVLDARAVDLLRGRAPAAARRGRRRARSAARFSGRWPTPVNICGRVRTSFTGRPTRAPRGRPGSRAATPGARPRTRRRRTARAPGPPSPGCRRPRQGRRARIDGHCVASCTVSRSPSQAATVANSPSGLLVLSGVRVGRPSIVTSATARPAATSPRCAVRVPRVRLVPARGSSRSRSGSAGS